MDEFVTHVSARRTQSNWTWWIGMFVASMIAFTLVIAIDFIWTGSRQPQPTPAPVYVIAPSSPNPTPSPTPTVERKKLKSVKTLANPDDSDPYLVPIPSGK